MSAYSAGKVLPLFTTPRDAGTNASKNNSIASREMEVVLASAVYS